MIPDPSPLEFERKRNPFTRTGGRFHGGKLLSAMMRPYFTVLPPRGFGVLTTTGRKTGKQRRKCVHAARDGEKVYILMLRLTPHTIAVKANSAWLLNIRADPWVRLRIRGGNFAGRARELHDAAEIEEARAVYLRSVNPFDYVECAFHRPGLPTGAKIDELHRSWFSTAVPLVVELQEGGATRGAA